MKMYFGKSKQLKILFVGPEVVPYVKVGGLAEVLQALPKALRELGHDVRVMMPLYATIDQHEYNMQTIIERLTVPNTEDSELTCNVKVVTDDTQTTYFLENEEYYEKRSSVYGYDDDAARWALLSRGALEFIRHEKGWRPDIIVANDWQGGLISNYLKVNYKDDPVLSKIASVFVIHNIFYQGMFDYRHTSELDYDDGQSAIPDITDPRMLKINFMRRGIRYADVINTVSPTYAREITTPEFGELLDPLLQERRSRLFGILNGINYDSYNPETNPYIEYNYTVHDLDERKKNKKILQQKFNLPERPDAFIAAVVSRLSEQKGLDLIMESMEHLLENFDFQFIVLGSGESRYHAYFEGLDERFPQVATHLSFDTILPHVLYAGADVILMPSRFEPSGLTQMEAMRYGAIPVARKIGGLADSVIDFNPNESEGNGFTFEHYNSHAFFGTFIRALETFKYPKTWQSIQKRAMHTNFSWEKSAKEYLKLFDRALNQFNR